jgi:type III restriction enzyme
MPDSIDNPILNSPYDPPTLHFDVGPNGPTGQINEGRRPSESFIPIAATRKGPRAVGVQEAIDFDLTNERRERNVLINELRREVDRWRQRDYERGTPISRKLLQHWADPARENRVLFCQREAAETAIFLAEVAGRHGYTDWRRRLDEENTAHNSGLPRVALKMATGSGKTIVMAMLIAWQTINKVYSPRDARFAKRFLVIAPGITIRDRLRVLFPSDPDNYYAMRDLIPPDVEGALHQAQIIITNYHSFLPRDAKEIKGVSKMTRQILLAGKSIDPFRETPDAMVGRVLRDFATSVSAATRGSRKLSSSTTRHITVTRTSLLMRSPATASRPRSSRRPTRRRGFGSKGSRRSTVGSASNRSMTCPPLRSTSRDRGTTKASSSLGQ